MIRSFRHFGLEAFYRAGSKRGIQPAHAAKVEGQLLALETASVPQEMNVPGWRLHKLRGELSRHWSIQVNGNWRLTFFFDGKDVVLVDYQDYH